MKKIKKDADVNEIQAPVKSITPQFSNITSIYSHEDFAIIDFGFMAPPYDQESDYFEDTQIARICLTWDAIKELSDMLASIIESHTTEVKKEKSKAPKD
jgi:hypothetical protein